MCASLGSWCKFEIDLRQIFLCQTPVLYPMVIARAVRYRVLKWARYASDVCFACPTWLYKLFVRTLISLTNAYAGCGRPTLNFIERFELGSVRSDSEASSPRVSQSGASSSTICTDYFELFSMNVNLKMFCILCLCFILCDTSKASENLTFILKRSLILSTDFVINSNLLLSGCHEDQRLCRTNDIKFISQLWCAWGSDNKLLSWK